MRRSRIIITAVIVAILGAVLPIVGMLALSWQLALRSERQQMGAMAQLVLTRSERAYGQTLTALRDIERGAYAPCSAAHIAAMRTIALSNTAVDEFGWFDQRNLLRCTSWGLIEEDVPQPRIDYTTADGVAVTLRINPIVSRGHPMIAMRHGAHNALVDPTRLLDLIVEPQLRIALATADGQLIGALHDPDPMLVQHALKGAHEGFDDATVHAVAQRGDWIAVVSEPRALMLENLRREQIVLLPVALLVAGALVAAVVWVSRRRLSLQAELETAVRRHEFVVHYQPVVELASGACAGAEALVRWRRPDGTLVRPDLFIPLAEDSGLIRPITDQVIAIVLRELGPLMARDRDLHVAINLSADDVRSGRVIDVIARAIAGTGVLPEQLWLEATERGLMDIDAAQRSIAAARAAGHAMAIDDFGTGYSSLQYLQSLPMDALKIDKAFVDTIGRDSATSAVTAHIIGMGKALGLYLLAEGVETREQADYLIAHGVDFAQGWLFAAAMPAADFIAYREDSLRRHGRPAARPHHARPLRAPDHTRR